MHEYFILVGCFVDAMQSPCCPGAYTLAEKETRKRTKIFNSKNTASSSKHYLLEYLVIFFEEPARTSRQKKKKYRGKQLEKQLRRTVVPGIRITSRTLWTTTNKLEAGPAAKGRDNEGQMRRSHVCFFGVVATCDVPGTCPTQNCRYSTPSRWDHEKTNLVFRRSPDRGGILTSRKKALKTYFLCFFAFVRVCQLSTGTYHECHKCAEIPSHP